MSDTLKVNMTLTHVIISKNKMCIEEVTAITEALKVNTTLLEIEIDESIDVSPYLLRNKRLDTKRKIVLLKRTTINDDLIRVIVDYLLDTKDVYG